VAAAEAHVFVDDLDRPALTDRDQHHLGRVLRLRPAAPLTVGDGRGRWRTARFGPTLGDLGAVHEEARPAPPLTVGFALLKGERPELVVQKLTEIGVDRIVLLEADRNVVRWPADRAEHHLTRLRAVAREAAMQSRRAHLVRLDPPVRARAVVSEPDAALAVPGGGPLIGVTTVLVGPEGGWSPEERAAARVEVGLGPYVLRAETAAIVAGALLVAARSVG
jgi:16S rRNA (uracil1498-N3)-methyltransferase